MVSRLVGYRSQVHHERIDDADLPLYISEPEVATASHVAVGDLVRLARAAVAAPADPIPVLGDPTGRPPPTSRPSPCFQRLIQVPGDDLAAVVTTWWQRTRRNGAARVGRELSVSEAHLDTGTWILHARLRRGVGRRSLPVTIDLWAHSRRFTRVSLVPTGPVITTRHYFRVGHRALDGLERDLAAAARR